MSHAKYARIRKLAIVIAVIVTIIVAFAYIALCRGFYAASNKSISEYSGPASLQFLSGSECYAVARNRYDQPMFRDARSAFNQALLDYADAIALICAEFHHEYDMPAFSESSYHIYKVLSWQIPTGEEAIRRQGHDMTKFLDIYENSLKRWFLKQTG